MASFVWVLVTAIVALLRFTSGSGLYRHVSANGRACPDLRTGCEFTLEVKGRSQHRSAGFDIVQIFSGTEVPLHVAVEETQIPPVELVADARGSLPGEIDLSGSHVQVIKRIPPAVQVDVAADTDDGIDVAPVRALLPYTPDRSDPFRCVQVQGNIEVSRAGNDIQRSAIRLPDAVTPGQGPDPGPRVDVSVETPADTGAAQRAPTVDRQVQVDTVDRERPPGPTGLEVAECGHLEVVQQVIHADLDLAARGRLDVDRGDPEIGRDTEPPLVGRPPVGGPCRYRGDGQGNGAERGRGVFTGSHFFCLGNRQGCRESRAIGPCSRAIEKANTFSRQNGF